MNQQNLCLPLFASNVFQLHIDYDTSALLQDKSWIYSANQNHKIPNENYRILEKYPDIRNILLDKFRDVSKTFMKYSNDYIISTSWLTITKPGREDSHTITFIKTVSIVVFITMMNMKRVLVS